MTNLIPLAIADLDLQLATPIGIGGTSFTLSSALDDDGVALPSGMYCFTVDNGTTNKEYLLGQVNGTAVTSVKSVSRQGVSTSGSVRPHRVGASCIVSDFATIQRVADALRGQIALDGANPLYYDAAPTLSNGAQLATVAYVLGIVSGGTVNFDSQIISSILAGETIVAGNLVYLKVSDQRWWKASAATIATVDGVRLGIAQGSGSAGVAITGGVLLNGPWTTSGLTVGAYYASDTAGAISTTPGTNSVPIGVAVLTTRLFLFPREINSPTADQKAALASGVGTPSATNTYKLQNKAMTAGATINGATLPVPVYQDSSTFKYLACAANDTTKMKFQGLATSNSTDTNPINVQFDGIVAGFTGLTRGLAYYIQDAVGTIGTTPGTNTILVGIAISTTEILIQKGNRVSSGPVNFSATATATITLGFRPKRVQIYAVVHNGGVNDIWGSSNGGWTLEGGNVCAAVFNDDTAGTAGGASTQNKAWQVSQVLGATEHTGIVDTITDTSFRLNNTKTGAPGTLYLFWTADGDI